MNLYIGIDLGTSSLKILVCNGHGEVLKEYAEPYPTNIRKNGWHEQSPSDWVGALNKNFEKLKEEAPELLPLVKAISVTGQMHGFVAMNQQGMPVYPSIIWSDQRNKEELSHLDSILTREEWVKRTGSVPNISFTLGKLMWFSKNCPSEYEQTSQVLFPKDFIRFQLTGLCATDYSDASGSLMMDIKTGEWDSRILKITGIDPAKLPPIRESNSIAGYTTKSTAETYGLTEGIPVICGCGDALAQAIGNGVVTEEDWLCTIGTSGQLFASSDQCNEKVPSSLHVIRHGIPDKWAVMGATLSAGKSFEWLMESALGERWSYEDLLNLASSVPPGAGNLLFFPYLNGERTPYLDSRLKGAFIGLTSIHTVAHLARAVVEGVLFSLYTSYSLLREVLPTCPSRIILTGGATTHPLWLEVARDLFDIPVISQGAKGRGAYGAAILAVSAIDYKGDMQKLKMTWMKLESPDSNYEQDERNSEKYQRLFIIYERHAEKLKQVSHDLDLLN